MKGSAWMRGKISLFLVVILLFTIGAPVVANSITIADTNLKSAIQEELNITSGELTSEQLSKLYDLDGTNRGIKSLAGLENASELTNLSLSNNLITDISPINNLTKLNWLELGNNRISSLSSLTKHTSLVGLDVSNNLVSDITPLSGLTNLAVVNLMNNQITNLSALSKLSNLQGLYLSKNKISNISPLATLNITDGEITLANNLITDISPLSQIKVSKALSLDISFNQIKSLEPLKNITNVTKLLAANNQITSLQYMSTLKSIHTLDVGFNNLTSLNGLNLTSSTTHYNLSFNNNKITAVTQLSYIRKGDIDLSNNLIKDLSPLKNMQSGSLYLTGNPLNSTSLSIIQTLRDRGVQVEFEAVKPTVTRLSGKDRFGTAIAVARAGWTTANTVIIARGYDFPDALAAAPLAYKLNAPILLTQTAGLTADTKKLISDLRAKNAIILGGPLVVSKTVETELKGAGVTSIERLAGKNRYETASLIAAKLGGTPDTAVVAYGYDFPDALAAASYAARNGYPILLTAKDSIPAETSKMLVGKKRTIVVGGEGVVSKAVFSKLPGAQRISGTTRFETAANLVEQLNLTANKVYIANGRNFPDALAGSVLAAKENAPMLLVEQNSLPTATKDILVSRYTKSVVILGGTGVVTDTVKKLIENP